MTPKQEAALRHALEALEFYPVMVNHWKAVLLPAAQAIREALAEQPAQQQEPVAWIYEDELPECYPYDDMYGLSRIIEGVRMFPVNVAPPASKPWVGLTDEQIDRAIAELGLNYFADAANNRAVLRELCRKAAHGIKGNI